MVGLARWFPSRVQQLSVPNSSVLQACLLQRLSHDLRHRPEREAGLSLLDGHDATPCKTAAFVDAARQAHAPACYEDGLNHHEQTTRPDMDRHPAHT